MSVLLAYASASNYKRRLDERCCNVAELVHWNLDRVIKNPIQISPFDVNLKFKIEAGQGYKWMKVWQHIRKIVHSLKTTYNRTPALVFRG